ncbi:MAG: EAL domain-containing protein [Deltaproteobacteria bacterium]|nr:EAL domain-containing protein [Deltaproteobacteria bacterium]
MMSLANPGVLGTLALVLAGALLLMMHRTHWLRLHEADSSLSTAAIGIRVAAVGLLTGGAVVALAAVLAPSEAWAWLINAETLAAVSLILLLCFLDGELDRLWILLGSGLAAGTAWIGVGWLAGLETPPGIGPSAGSLTAAAVSALLLSPGPTTRLVSRVRRKAVEAAGNHVILVNPEGCILYVSDAGRAALGLEKPTTDTLVGSHEVLPKALQQLHGDTERRKKARLRTPSGLILEARIVDLAQRFRLRRASAILIRDVTDEHRDERRLVRLAHYDSLTGLANRRLFLETLKTTLESPGSEPRQAALFYLDLDGFKAINDSLGHAGGDALLKALAERFRTHLRPEEVSRFGIVRDARLVIARLAGDEFAVIAPRIPDAEAAGELARFMIEIVRRPLELSDRTLSPSVSIGVALFPEDGQDVEQLLRHADSALYVAKSRGRQRFAWYEASFDTKADRARVLEEGLRGALDRQEMCLHYQPKVDTQSGELVGFEALLRWRNPELGEVGPAEFIPVAEARGLITKLGSWCLDDACRQIRAWEDAGYQIVPVAVNVSSAQFAESDLQRDVSTALKNHRVDPSHLELELTESLLLDEGKDVEVILRDLRSIGVRIALDDFGTGYSALTYLNRFNLDVLKMDRGLLRDIDTNPSALGIASAVVAMAHSLGLCVVAEGVDMEEQLPILRDMSCDHIQGFLFAPALPADEVVRFMARAGEEGVTFGPGMTVPGKRPAATDIDEDTLDEPVLRTDLPPAPAHTSAPSEDKGRVLLIDNGSGYLGTVALRLGHLGIDIHYASALDEAHLFIAQERDAIRLIACPPTIDAKAVRGVLDSLAQATGEDRRFIVIGERPNDATRQKFRDAGVDWVLWAPFNDAELRYVVKSGMARREDLIDRREVRVPVDLIANIWSGERREVAVVSSLSPRGAFIELSEPLRMGSSLRIEMDLAGDRFRGFARVVHVHAEDADQPNEPSGVGVTFYGADRDEERLLRKAISELESRYLP